MTNNICPHLWTPCTPAMTGYFSRIMHHDNGLSLLPRIGLRRILETSNEWCDHHIHPTWARWSIYDIEVHFHASTNIKWLNISPASLLTNYGINATNNYCTAKLYETLYKTRHINVYYLTITILAWNTQFKNIYLFIDFCLFVCLLILSMVLL